MNWALVALRFLLPPKILKIVFGILAFLIALPMIGLVVVAAAPETIVLKAFDSLTGTGAAGIKPSSVAIMGDFSYPGDNYAPGNCTYWVFARRAQVGLPIPNTWGDAATWATRAAKDSYVVDHTPAQYAIMQTPNSAGGLGHVAFVEKVDADGTWHISEMNVLGLYIKDDKAVPPDKATAYNFIHEKEGR
ncbi:MAG TPA: CHAP domain-containing protein [Candidatus Saccharimonadales bacterium]|nr:CHAP domain-containing protein [Candidatus Saccharimonadales bacterium]